MAYGSLAAVVAGTALLTFAIAWVAASPGADASRRALLILAGGACGSAVVLLCGVGASGIVKSPVVAVLLGVFLLGLPLLLATELSSRFPAAAIGIIPLGGVWPALLIPAYLIAGWVGATRGEPMGRGAIRRMSVVLVAGLVAVVAGFFLSGVCAMHHEATAGSLMFDVEMPNKAGWHISGQSVPQSPPINLLI